MNSQNRRSRKRKNPKKIFLIVFSIIIVTILGLKTYFEIGNIIYEKQIDEMNLQIDQMKGLAEHKTLEINGSDIHYYVSGEENNDLVLLLHPLFSDHRAFDQQIASLSKNYRVITIDLIGHGLSTANESTDKIDASSKQIEKIIEIEGFNKVHLVGVSMGSWVAQYFALNNPDKVESLVALGGYDINNEIKDVMQAQASSKLGLALRAILSMKSYRHKIAEITCHTEKGQALFYEATSYWERKSFIKMAGLIKIIKVRESNTPQYPTLILAGEFDLDSNIEMAKEWHSKINNSELFILKDAGHCANIDKPSEFNKLVESFIQKSAI